MHLRRIELQGFKTFPRRTAVELPPGITAIVGPNGSGKSNLSDAIRWAMGEQAPTNLRIRKAEDVIFAGSEVRSRQSMAEVLLTFDNASDWLPTEFDEVVIGRRLFRSGESEYTLNGARVRLRDIVDLMSAGSASHGGHSVISQGQIDQVLQQRPEGRRAFLEEAAGVARFYTRRDQAQRRLKETRRNLERLRDLVSEIEPRIEILRDQAAVAEQGEELGRELRSGQLTIAKHKLFVVTERLDAAESREQAAAAALTSILAEPVEELRRQAAAAAMLVKDLEAKLVDVRHELEVRREAAAERAARGVVLEERRSNLQARFTDLATQHEQLLARADGLEEEAGVARQALVELEAHLVEVRSEQVELSTALAPERDRTKQRTAIGEKLEKLKDRRSSLLERHRNASEERKELASQLKQLEGKISEAERASVVARELAQSAVLAAREASDGLEEATLAHQEAVRAARDGQQAEAEIRSQLDVAINTVKSLERERAGMKEAYAEAGATSIDIEKIRAEIPKTAISGQLRDQLHAVGTEGIILLEAAFPDGLDTVIVQAPEDGVAVSDAAARLQMPRVRWRPVDGFLGWPYEGSSKDHTADEILGNLGDMVTVAGDGSRVFQRLLENILVTKDLGSALRVRQNSVDVNGHTIVTLRGDAIEPDGTVRIGKSGQATIDVRERIATTDREIERVRTKVVGLKISLGAATEVLAQADKELANTEALLAERQVAQVAMQAAAAEATHGQQDNESEVRVFRTGAQDLRDRGSALETIVSTADSEIGELAGTIEQLSDELRRVGGSGGESSTSETRLAALDATLAAGLSRVEELNLQDRSRSTAATTARAEVDTVKKSLIDVEQGLVDVADALKALEPESSDNAELDTDHVRTMEAQALDARLDLQRLEFQAGQRAGEQERAEAAVAMAQRETERLAERRQEIRGQARDELGEDNLDPEKSSDSVGGIERRNAELRRMLETLGPVNPLAPAEYASERKRVEDARGQIDDLEGAAHNLYTLARDLQQQLHDEFMTTFDAINDAFGAVFTELFGGGSARMELTSPEDVEQTGVEFSIKLPGKRAQELAALSGGERALVGAALILALLRVRPAPFCLLDEVDAALDDQNVARFCQQIDDLSTRTQMMMITHNAVTVEAASTVYGVTMSEDGVSELLSVRLDEVGTNADGVGGLSEKPAPPVAAAGTRDGVS